VHSATENFSKRAVESKDKAAAFRYSEAAEQEAVHPVIRTHPESGRDALYVNRSFTKWFAGMTRGESAPILGFLFDHLSRPEFTCRLRWRAGTLAFWDNRCAQHYALNDYHGHRRVMNRVTVLGDEPFLAERSIADAA
jgi:taurine dioxygenase